MGTCAGMDRRQWSRRRQSVGQGPRVWKGRWSRAVGEEEDLEGSTMMSRVGTMRRRLSATAASRCDTGMLLAVVFVGVLTTVPPGADAVFSSSSVTIFPQQFCTAAHMEIKFTAGQAYDDTDVINLFLPGFTTSTDCGGDDGDDIFHDELVYTNSTRFNVRWYEGDPALMYDDSRIEIEPKSAGMAIANAEAVVIRVDASNGIKYACKRTNKVVYLKPDGLPAERTNITMTLPSCGMSTSSMTFQPQAEKTPLAITYTFVPTISLVGNDNITIAMPGFTTGDGEGTAGSSLTIGNVGMRPAQSFRAAWTEGTFVQDKPGFVNSAVTITVKMGETFDAGDELVIEIEPGANIKAQCGFAPNKEGFNVSVTAAAGSFSSDAFDSVAMIGVGCSNLNDCSGQGTCDYCLHTCDCFTGFGASTDIVDDDVAADCSEHVCPSGISFASVPTSTTAAHPRTECSSSGICNRDNGLCECFDGFAGPACERLACPTSIAGMDCSGHGRCLSMEQAAKESDALPLTNTSVTTRYRLDQSTADGATWDADKLSVCVCDSSWTVGLGSGESQEPEWFGPDCSLKHCPSGDNPDTTADELNCYGRLAAGGRGTGQSGNLCHVDCSNRGVCDYRTGTCSCFDGYINENCGAVKFASNDTDTSS